MVLRKGLMALMIATIFSANLGLVAKPVDGAVQPVVSIIINNRVVPSDTSPAIINDRTYVPIRVISENLGATVTWIEDRQLVVINWQTTATPSLPAARPGEVQIVLDGKLMVIPNGYGKAFINQQWRTMVPLRAVAEAMNFKVIWDGAGNQVIITSSKMSSEGKLLMDLARYQTNLKLLDGSVINSRELIKQGPVVYSPEQLEVFKSYLGELQKYGPTISLPGGGIINTSDMTIMGTSYLSSAQLKQWIRSETPRIKANMAAQGRTFNPINPDLADLYVQIGAQYGIRGDLAFCQSAKETGYWQYTGSVQPWQNNYCGLWATGSPLTGLESFNGADPFKVRFQAGIHGAIFSNPAAGVEAHIQHLYAYASKKALPAGKQLIDPRFVLVNRGIAPTWLGLNARWAVPGITYGQSIISDYWAKAAASR